MSSKVCIADLKQLIFLFIVILLFSSCSNKNLDKNQSQQGLFLKSDFESFLEIPLLSKWTPREFKINSSLNEEVQFFDIVFKQESGTLPQGSAMKILRNPKGLIEKKSFLPAPEKGERRWSVFKRAWFSQISFQVVKAPCQTSTESLEVNLSEGLAVRIKENSQVLEVIFASERLFEDILKENAYKKCDF